MITAIVQFDLPKDIDRHKAEETFKKIAPLYQNMDGLIQKYFCFSEEGKGAGIYVWGGTAIVTECQLRDNTAHSGGGAIIYDGHLVLLRSAVTGNHATYVRYTPRAPHPPYNAPLTHSLASARRRCLRAHQHQHTHRHQLA